MKKKKWKRKNKKEKHNPYASSATVVEEIFAFVLLNEIVIILPSVANLRRSSRPLIATIPGVLVKHSASCNSVLMSQPTNSIQLKNPKTCIAAAVKPMKKRFWGQKSVFMHGHIVLAKGLFVTTTLTLVRFLPNQYAIFRC